MISLKQLTLARAGHPLIEGADLQIHPGWRVGLVGANGAGKSTLLLHLNGTLPPTSGTVRIGRRCGPGPPP